MKKALLVVLAVALMAWFISWFHAGDAVATAAARPWPGGGATLDSVATRFPPRPGNDASRQFMRLASALPKNERLDAYVRREIARDGVTIRNAPPLPDIAAMTELLLRQPVQWERRVAFDDSDVAERRAMQMNAARALIATALSKARANDPTAWNALQAAWNLARSLDGQPQLMAQTAALTIARMINAVAWKMPLPVPPWFADLQQRDAVDPLLEAFQYQTASYWQDGSSIFPTKFLAGSVDHDRAIAAEVHNTTQCDVTTAMNDLGPDLRSVWRRAFRYRAEREATRNALRVREGSPIETKSVCRDGMWSFDGTTLRFSREIPTGTSDTAMPLVLRVEAP